MLSGWQTIGSNKYYFGSADDGVMKTGWLKYNNYWYYFLTNGTMATGWVNFSGSWR
jgi:glucan-binding YG repeat protein